jgi:Lon protease-like protein
MDDDLDLKDFTGTGRLFPLPGVVLFPHVVLPLHVFEPRYRRMTEAALAGDRLITIVALKAGADPGGPGAPAIEPVGCLGRILNCERLADGRFNALLLGRKRVRIVKELAVKTPYRQAELELIEDIAPGDESPWRADLARVFRELVASKGPVDPELDALLNSDLPLGALTDIATHALGLPWRIKQQLLEEARAARRAEFLLGLLGQTAQLGHSCARRPAYPPPIHLN